MANATRQNFWKSALRTEPRAKPYLSPTEEKDLGGFLIESAKVDYGKSCQQVKSIAAHGIRDKGHLDADTVLSKLVLSLYE